MTGLEPRLSKHRSILTTIPCAPLLLSWRRLRDSQTAWRTWSKGQAIGVDCVKNGTDMGHETSVNVDTEGSSTPVCIRITCGTARPKKRGIGRINISLCLFAFGERESSGKLSTTFSTWTCNTRNYFLENHRFTIAIIFSSHRPVPIRIRVAVKRRLKLLAVHVKMGWWNAPAAAHVELRERRARTRQSRL